MSSEPSPSDPSTPAPPADPPNEGGQTRGLQEALKSERARRQEMEARITAMETEKAAAEQLAAEKRGEFKQLWEASQEELLSIREQLLSHETRDAARAERLTAANVERLQALPETFRALVPAGLDAEATAEHLAKLESVLSQNTPTGGIPPVRGPQSVETIPQECILEAERYGYTDARKYFPVWKARQDRKKG